MTKKYVTKKELLNTRIYVESALNKIREDLRKSGFTFSHQLTGSGGRNLATKQNNVFDLDYILIFEETKNKNLSIKPSIKQLVRETLEKHKSESSKVNDSTSSIHYFSTNAKGNIIIQSDICIVIKRKDKTFQIKGKGGKYSELITKDFSNIMEKFEQIKSESFNEFKNKYLLAIQNKKPDETSNFEIFIDTVSRF